MYDLTDSLGITTDVTNITTTEVTNKEPERAELGFPGEVYINKADLINHSGVGSDITSLIQELTLYEDMFANALTGHMLIEDANELIGKFPIIGQELFVLELQTPSFKEKISKKFYIYKMQHRTVNKRVQKYVLYFCSIEMINSINSKVAKAFDGYIHDVVLEIFRNERYLAVDEASETKIRYEKTKNKVKFVAPYWTPFQTLNWLCERSINKNDVPNYVFYEDNKTFVFTSIEQLFDSGTVRDYIASDSDQQTVALADGAKTTANFDEQYKIIESLDNNVVFDYFRNLAAGMYKSLLYTFDVTTKNIDRTDYNYIRDFDKNKHSETTPFPLKAKDLLSKKASSVNHVIKNNFTWGENLPVEYSKFFLQRNSLMEQVSAFKLGIKVLGRTDIKVGDMISLTTPEMREILKDDIETEDSKSKIFSGRYLITAIRHQIIGSKHTMNMEIVSDSFMKELV